MARKDDSISLDDLNPLELEGTVEDIELVERGLAVLARKQIVWASVVEAWKKRAGIPSSAPASLLMASAPSLTLSNLTHSYRTDARSSFQKLQHLTRANYDATIRRLNSAFGEEKLAAWKAGDIQRVYERFSEGGKISMGQSLVAIVRALFAFGATVLQDSECERLSVVLSKMTFARPQPRTEHITKVHADAIRSRAHALGFPSIALAQAFQFECSMRQKDVIGQWVPQSEAGAPSEILSDGMKWLRGLRWSHIDENFVLRRAGKRFKPIDLKRIPAIMEEITFYKEKFGSGGPVVVYEKSGLPYYDHQFRTKWREIARAAGVPDDVYNMDSRERTSASELLQETETEKLRTTESS